MKRKDIAKRILALVVVASACIVLWPEVSGSMAASSYQSQIDAAKKKKTELEKKSEELKKKIAEMNEKNADLKAYISDIDNQIAAVMDEFTKISEQIEENEKKLEKTTGELDSIKLIEEAQYNTMKQRIRYMYENSEPSVLALFLGESSITDILNTLEYRQQIAEYDNKMLSDYKSTIEKKTETEALLTAQLEELNSMKDYQEEQLNGLEAMAEAKNEELLKLAESLDMDEKMLYEYWDEISKATSNIKTLEKKEAERIAEEKRKAEEEAKKKAMLAEASGNKVLANMIWPVPDSKRITEHFGKRDIPIAGASAWHNAIDIGANTGTPVVAAQSGKVIISRYSSTAGNYIRIDHGNGVITKYCHGSKLLVKEGQYVEKGQKIMLVGSTGLSTGAHLDFSIMVNGSNVDPEKYVWPGKK